MKCVNCGSEVSSSSSFCPICGNVVHHQTPQNAPAAVRTPTPKKSRKNTGFILVIILLLVVVLALSATVGFLLFRDMDKSESDESEAVAVETQDKKSVEEEDSIFTDETTEEQSQEEVEYESEEAERTWELTEEKTEEEAEGTPEEIPEPDKDDSYLFPSHTTYLTRSYLDTLTREEVDFIRNEIFARRGYIFSTEPYKTYFSQKSWYTPNPDFNVSLFNSIEMANKNFIVAYEQEKGWM